MYTVHCGKDLASIHSSNKDDVSSNSSLEALQRLTHHLKGFILLAAVAAQINDSEGSDEYFSSKFLNLSW